MNPRLGLFGKLAAMGDFVAYNASTPTGRELDSWLQAGVDTVIRRGKNLPPYPVHFLFCDSTHSGACVGVFVPSQDGVGRKFPLAAFIYLDMAVAVHRFPALPAAYAPWLDGAAALLAQNATADPNALLQHLAAIPVPAPQELEEARLWGHQALTATPSQALLEAVFGPIASGVQYHGLNMFLTACSQLRGQDPGLAATVLECRASDNVQLVFWLQFAYEVLGWRTAPPGLFWSGADSQDPRLMVSLGTPDPGVFHYLADPTLRSERLWPTITDNARSIDHGRQSLDPSILKALDPPCATASQLLASLIAPSHASSSPE
ncbi:MAG: type VI secretion system-associated protein TagF [Myxococcota bacterium]